MMILYIDDDPASIKLVAKVLGLMGHRIISAPNVRTGLSLAHREPPELILMDLHLPHINGLEGIYLLQNMPTLATIPIIGVTSQSDEDTMNAFLDLGCIAFVPKPIQPELLLEAVKRVG